MNDLERSELQASFGAAFRGRLVSDDEALAPLLVDWRGRYRGRTIAAAQPDSVADVAAVVRWCAERGIALVPQGGNTGMSGAATPDESGHSVILSLARLRAVRAVDPLNNTITVEAGCTLVEVQDAARAAGRLFPLSLPSEGSCTIGGNLATNAGGCQVLRYGNARELCLGLEVVTAEGEIWNGLRGLRKDNTGYDLRDLYVGSEGTLGVITAATLKLFPLPAAQLTAFAAVDDPRAALRLLAMAQARLASGLTAFEMITAPCMELVAKHFPDGARPFAEPSPAYVLLEYSDPQGEREAAAHIEALLGEALEAGVIRDAVVADSIRRSRELWALRENIPHAQSMEGKNIKHDVSVPISSIADFIEGTSAALQAAHPGVRMIVFGHLGDGNLHFNVSPPPALAGAANETDFLALQPSINRITHDAVVAYHGSISAEHGLGVLRRDEAARYKSPVELGLMRRIKRTLDPQGIMNPGKVLAPATGDSQVSRSGPSAG